MSGVKLDRDNRETALETIRKVLHIVAKLQFRPLMAKIGPISPTLQNHHLLGGGVHHVGLPLGVPTFLNLLTLDRYHNR